MTPDQAPLEGMSGALSDPECERLVLLVGMEDSQLALAVEAQFRALLSRLNAPVPSVEGPPMLLEAAEVVAALLEGIREDQVSVLMGLGATALERADRRRQLGAFIEANCEALDEALPKLRAAILQASPAVTAGQSREGGEWQPIETAPKDGTVIDVWRTESGRDTVFWGYPPHECGEMGGLCDSDWHGIKRPGWICSTFGEFIGGKHNPFTHWRPLPAPPSTPQEPGQ